MVPPREVRSRRPVNEVYPGFFSLNLLAMAYHYNVFLSYRRYREWPGWVAQTFHPLLEHWLGEELGEEPAVFWDVDIETGNNWPQRLAQALAHSRVLVPLLSRQYFTSTWCKTEFGVMRAREERLQFRTVSRPDGLIVPAYIHDGQDFPAEIQQIQAANLQEYVNVRMARNSVAEEELSRRIRSWVPDIAAAIRQAPEWDSDWESLTAQQFLEAFNMPAKRQTTVPSLGI